MCRLEIDVLSVGSIIIHTLNNKLTVHYLKTWRFTAINKFIAINISRRAGLLRLRPRLLIIDSAFHVTYLVCDCLCAFSNLILLFSSAN